MKFIIALALLLVPSAVWGQSAETFRAISGSQVVSYSSTSVTAGNQVSTEVVELTCTTACFIAFGSSAEGFDGGGGVVAVAGSGDSFYRPANVPVQRRVERDSWVAVIRVGADGVLYITELDK